MIAVVLNDGETFSAGEGCKIVRIPRRMENADPDVVSHWLKHGNISKQTLAVIRDDGIKFVF